MFTIDCKTVLKHASFTVVAIVAVACGPYKTSRFYPEIIPAKPESTLSIGSGGASTVNVTYMGCGNIFLEKAGNAVMFDPFFSTQGFLKMAGKVKTRAADYEYWKSTLQQYVSRSSVRAALVSHTHYDHVMDLPTLLHDKHFPNMDVVYGNNYLPEMMINFRKSGVDVRSLTDDQIFNPAGNDSQYAWVNAAPNIRFLPIRSTHAPHTRNRLFMNKPLKPGYFGKKLVWPGDKVGAFKWTCGDTYAFLVDFLGADTLRVYVQTSASEHPRGFPPQAELSRRKVDLAIICYASAMNVSNYPNALVDFIKPSKVMFVHWEDFFRRYRSDNDVKLVRGTNPGKVRKRVDLLGRKKDFFTMPRPGSKVVVRY